MTPPTTPTREQLKEMLNDLKAYVTDDRTSDDFLSKHGMDIKKSIYTEVADRVLAYLSRPAPEELRKVMEGSIGGYKAHDGRFLEHILGTHHLAVCADKVLARIAPWVNEPKPNEAANEEHKRRVYYQGIVYDVCNMIDRHIGDGSKVVCGTVDAPNDGVQVVLKRLLRSEPKAPDAGSSPKHGSMCSYCGLLDGTHSETCVSSSAKASTPSPLGNDQSAAGAKGESPKDYIGALRHLLDVRHPESHEFDRVFQYAVVQVIQANRMHEPVKMPKDRTALIERACSHDEGCISAGIPATPSPVATHRLGVYGVDWAMFGGDDAKQLAMKDCRLSWHSDNWRYYQDSNTLAWFMDRDGVNTKWGKENPEPEALAFLAAHPIPEDKLKLAAVKGETDDAELEKAIKELHAFVMAKTISKFDERFFLGRLDSLIRAARQRSAQFAKPMWPVMDKHNNTVIAWFAYESYAHEGVQRIWRDFSVGPATTSPGDLLTKEERKEIEDAREASWSGKQLKQTVYSVIDRLAPPPSTAMHEPELPPCPRCNAKDGHETYCPWHGVEFTREERIKLASKSGGAA